jgi:hypothetical protein
LANKKTNISIKENETFLEFFKRQCDETGFNVSKIIQYLKCIDKWLEDYLAKSSKCLNEDIMMQIFDFGNYFVENYGEETREKRFLEFGYDDAFVLNIYFDIKNEEMKIDADNIYDDLTSVEKRKVDRMCQQFFAMDGDKHYILLEVDEETEEDLEPIVLSYTSKMTEDMQESVREIFRSCLLDMFIGEGVILCIINRDRNTLDPEECESLIMGVAFKDKNVALIDATSLFKTFYSIDNVAQNLKNFCDGEDIEFIDADTYINPLGMSQNEYNNLGEKLPNRRGKKINDNIVPFSAVISRRKKNLK